MVVDEQNQILFVHIPKTAGISITEALGGMSKQYRTHAPASDILPEHQHFLKFSVIRNPLSWYRSQYLFKLSGDKGYDQEGDFDEFLEDMLTITERSHRWFKPWPRPDPQAILEPYIRSGRQDLGYLTLNLLYYAFDDYEGIVSGHRPLPKGLSKPDGCLLDKVLKTESLGEDFAAMVAENKLAIDPGLLVRAPRKNVTPPQERDAAYTDAQRQAILDKDAFILQLFYPQDR